ncbi:MAG: hypothetical protein GC152_12120 [Alphaproteobacteria bacterium]|nr:hypothetical protein [Alphaproteobacteria bacterium]
MKKSVFAAIAAAPLAAALLAVAPANAASTSEQIALCVSALESKGIAPSGEYRSQFVKSRGASTKTLWIDLVPSSGETVSGVCKVRRGEVTEAARA